MRFLSPLLSILLAPLMATGPLLAQSPALGSSVSLTPDTAAASLQLRMAENDGTAVVAGTRSANGMSVEVTDPAGAPVQNAAVVFRLPDSAPSGKFADGTLAAVAYTDAQGRAKAKDIQWDSVIGTVAVRVTAVKDTMHAGLLFEENLTAPAVAAVGRAVPMAAPQIEPAAAKAVRMARMPTVVAEDPKVQPGELAAELPVAKTFVPSDDSPDANVPMRRMLGTAESGGGEPGVSISTSGAASSSGGHSKLKWILIAAVAAGGAGAALAFVHKGSSSSSSTGISIGSPSVSVGHP